MAKSDPDVSNFTRHREKTTAAILRAPQTKWEQETYNAAFAQGIVRRPLDEPS
jgi:hypothetical protein